MSFLTHSVMCDVIILMRQFLKKKSFSQLETVQLIKIPKSNADGVLCSLLKNRPRLYIYLAPIVIKE